MEIFGRRQFDNKNLVKSCVSCSIGLGSSFFSGRGKKCGQFLSVISILLNGKDSLFFFFLFFFSSFFLSFFHFIFTAYLLDTKCQSN